MRSQAGPNLKVVPAFVLVSLLTLAGVEDSLRGPWGEFLAPRQRVEYYTISIPAKDRVQPESMPLCLSPFHVLVLIGRPRSSRSYH